MRGPLAPFWSPTTSSQAAERVLRDTFWRPSQSESPALSNPVVVDLAAYRASRRDTPRR